FDQGFFVGHAGQLEGQGATQRPGGIQLVADDQVIAHGSAPSVWDFGAALQPIAGKPAPTGTAQGLKVTLYLWELACRRKGREAAPALNQVRYSALIFTYSWDRSVVQMVSLHWPRPSSIRMVISSWAITAAPCSSV